MNKNWLMFIAIILIEGAASSLLTPKFNIDASSLKTENLEAILSQLSSHASSPMIYLSQIISFIFAAVTTRMAFDAINGQKVSLNAFQMPAMTYVNFVATQIVVTFIAAIGTLFCVLPGIFVGIRLHLAPYYVIDRGYGIGDAIKASWHDTKGNFWGLLGAVIVIGLFSTIGVLACCVGAFYTAPAAAIASCVLARIFAQTSDYMPQA